MQARHIGRPNPTSQARLQLILAVLAAWNLLSFALELMNAGPINVDGVDGVLGARALSGATGVLGIAYLYAARNPVRYRFVLWLATLEQFVALFTATFHWARGDFGGSEAIVPIIVAAIFLVLLMTNQPRQTDTI
jgi:peptidoglycan/LPS O-acetylase OafA/YrhL